MQKTSAFLSLDKGWREAGVQDTCYLQRPIVDGRGVEQVLSELKVEQSVVLNLPAENSFTYVTDLENLVEWSSMVIAVRKTSPGGMQIGATWRATIRFLGRWLENTYVVVEWEAGRQITLKSTSGITPCHFSFTFEALEGGKTNLSQEAVINLRIKGGFMDVAEPVLASVLRRQVEHDLLTLKDLLEARVPIV